MGEDHALLDLVNQRLHPIVWLPRLAHVVLVLLVHRRRGRPVKREEVIEGAEELHPGVAQEDVALEVVGDVGIQPAQEAGDEGAVHVRVLNMTLV